MHTGKYCFTKKALSRTAVKQSCIRSRNIFMAYALHENLGTISSVG